MIIERSAFLRNLGLTATGLLGHRITAVGGVFLPGRQFTSEIPTDKKLDPEWVKSLHNRGKVTTYHKSRNELQYIGMPVGGAGCGTMYLGGDGRLWLWDVFNKNQEGIEPKVVKWNSDVLGEGARVRSRDGACYIEPSKNIRPVEQGFKITFEYGGQRKEYEMNEAAWKEVVFEATYPMATIHFKDDALPAAVSMEVFSPFIPLETDDSGLPVTIFSFRVLNKTKQPMKVSITGWLENKTCFYSLNAEWEYRAEKDFLRNGVAGVHQFTSSKTVSTGEEDTRPDYGTFCIAAFDEKAKTTEKATVNGKEVSLVAQDLGIGPSKTAQCNFAISWFMPNLRFREVKDEDRYYSRQFHSAEEVMLYTGSNFSRLYTQTKRWKDTWYNSTLPWWFLERTFLNISTLATSTSHRFASGRFYAWEGVGACPGTCTHVWQYAQAVGRLFPALERDTRERVDLGIALQEDGGIWFRGEAEKRPAIDGQAGTVLRIYREHTMTADAAFLQKNWPNIRKAVQFIMNQDRNGDGMEDTPMENTLDAIWDGEIAWIVGLCIAAVKAGELMAAEASDTAFAAACKTYVETGRANMESKLFNGEYFIHRPDAVKGRSKLGSYNTCHIDQVYGQSWAFQAGIGRVLNKEKTLSALRALWKYNFMPDVGPYIKTHTGGRPYALPGEGGMIMNTNPKQEAKPFGDHVTWQLGYFHECMTGFEHQVASHMMAEGMTDEALILTRAVHDRYHGAKRNPFNEIECSDHYARAMASYGTFISACGFAYHGPKGHIAFAPGMQADQFRSAFTTAKGWGSYRQVRKKEQQQHELQLAYGTLFLHAVQLEANRQARAVTVRLNGKQLAAGFTQEGNTVKVELKKKLEMEEGAILAVNIR